ncbi:TPA: RNA-guided pseudouridylation complex pseudouridine synthase subunit Cbf5 [Candidatus Woesearchaeota archaeon]|nr:RNA-guided pseudouridylation complex pseudouridine synthase subunit Cbf5 [Candidatus Woesearchaeota archaeon]HIH31525.1 RNA-guided pseudouridylation complex pseudouridine synthase subunit Cbf5 [Candidatus Woesearchaeota archaeon]HIH54317.1 RNA-guided pseudouridylation complex pseudouridine synthase subunit Cbf5 [Candidatus Woesearchaeota archaeon]HIJ02493.1 RNA-guided pseudouridylation complex pseudouridine synthase subunit Cbf5 [Candidatus Woesearchaeota archaeon]HIJ13461.1 RNA-guided pseud
MNLPFESLNREIIVKKEYESSNKFGKLPEEKSIEEMLNYSLINIDKPSGITSHQVSALVKDILEKEKAGHSGTLDPAVTGVLPIGVNKATRIMQWLLTAGKEYVCLMHIHDDFDKNKIINAMKQFTGKLMQLPPVKSAVKRQIRERNVYYVEIIDVDGRDVLFKIGTQAGTYIRKWVHDFGLTLGTNAHMVELRRTKAGPFNEDNLVTLTDLKDAYHYYKEGNPEKIRKMLITPESAVSHLKKIYVMDTTVNSLCHGAFLKVPGITSLEKNIDKEDIVAVFTLKNELILIGRALMDAEDIIKNERGIAVKTEQVFMDPGVYPRIERVE